MNPIRKKFMSLFLVFSLVMLSVNLYSQERRGATLLITKKDYKQIRGELITVKPNSLLLLDIGGRDVSVDISEIKIIKIVKKSKFLLGAGIGLLIGAGIGAIPFFRSGYWQISDDGGRALVGGGVGGFLGILIGGIFGLASGKDKTIQIEGRPPPSIEFILKKLSKKARIPDYK
jgi:hypothetical protein